MHQRTPFFLVLLLVLAGSACDASFDPLTETQTDFFAVFGFLDASADTQFVRVSPLRPRLDRASQPQGTQVTTMLLGEGTTVAWQDSLIRLNDGTTGLLFYAPFRATPGQRYRLVIQGPDDERTRAITRVPPAPPLETTAPRIVIGNFIQNVTWTGVTNQPDRVTLAYRLRFPDASAPDTTMIVAFQENGVATPEGWEYIINFDEGRREVYQRLERSETDPLILVDLHMEVELRSGEWRQQNESINIENGFGFFGAIGRYTQSWMLDAQATRRAGFIPP